MRMLFYMGWVFLLLAFAAAAAEAIPNTLPGGGGVFISAYDLWYAIKPGGLIVAQIKVEKISPVLWDPLIVSLLAVPGWLLGLVPGALLTWFCRPNKKMSETERQDLEKQEEAFLFLDELALEAKKAGYDDEDDRLPDPSRHDLLDSEGGTQPLEEENFPNTVMTDTGKDEE